MGAAQCSSYTRRATGGRPDTKHDPTVFPVRSKIKQSTKIAASASAALAAVCTACMSRGPSLEGYSGEELKTQLVFEFGQVEWTNLMLALFHQGELHKQTPFSL